MASLPLSGRSALVLGIERPLGRRAAIALAEGGADIAGVTLSEDTQAEFAANSAANECWAIGRKGIALTSDGRATAVAEAIADATAELGPISIIVWHADTPLPGDTLRGLRSDPAILVLIGGDAGNPERAALLAWTAELAAAGVRANAIVIGGAAAVPAGLPEHRPPEPLDVGAAAVYLASDASAAVEGCYVLAKDS